MSDHHYLIDTGVITSSFIAVVTSQSTLIFLSIVLCVLRIGVAIRDFLKKD